MLPRYLPHVDWRSWWSWLSGEDPDGEASAARLIDRLGGEALPRFHREFDTLRTGLLQYFSGVRNRAGAGNVVVSAQICAAVPLAIERAGLTVRYVDIASGYPTPGAPELAAAIDEATVAVLVAPIYGHIQSDWSALLQALNERILVLDMAQGLGLESRVAPLARRADAVAYSFGLGKGLDTGGGLLLTRSALADAVLPQRSKWALTGPLMKAIALRAMIATGFFGLVVGRLDRLDEAERPVPANGMSVPADMCRLWQARLPRLLAEIALARKRAQALAAMPSLVGLRDTAVCFDAEASHLRQLIRVPDASRRAALISRLRGAGVDCAPAGEPLPDVQSAGRRFPRAAAFRADAIRLPFLGRVSDGQFDEFRKTLEISVAECLR